MSRNYRKENERFALQVLIDDNTISTAQELSEYIEKKGWSIKRTAKLSDDGRNLLGVRMAPREIFLVRFGFDNSIFKPKAASGAKFFPEEQMFFNSANYKGIWIYGLFAESHSAKACYVGQTVQCLSRFRAHLKRSKNGRGSSGLFDWAEINNTSIRVILLDYVHNEKGNSDLARIATILEGTWLKRAIAAEFETPMVEKWGRLPFDPSRVKEGWPLEDISLRAIPLTDVVETMPNITSFAIPSLVEKLRVLKQIL